MTEAFTAALGNPGRMPERLDELADYFVDPDDVARKLRDMRGNRQAWRGEVHFRGATSGNRPLLVRADACLSTPIACWGSCCCLPISRSQGRRGCPPPLSGGDPAKLSSRAGRVNSKSDLKFQNLMSNVVENAQLAALEITDGVDLSAMPSMLESLLRSVSRTAEVMDQISFSLKR